MAIDAVAHCYEPVSSKARNTAVNTALVTFANLMLKQALLQDTFVRVKNVYHLVKTQPNLVVLS